MRTCEPEDADPWAAEGLGTVRQDAATGGKNQLPLMWEGGKPDEADGGGTLELTLLG